MNQIQHEQYTGKGGITPIECERLNGFPVDWTAGMPERMRYFTMGNALVVPLVKAMGKRISALAEDEQRS